MSLYYIQIHTQGEIQEFWEMAYCLPIISSYCYLIISPILSTIRTNLISIQIIVEKILNNYQNLETMLHYDCQLQNHY